MEPIIGISSLHFSWRNLEDAFERCKNELGLKVIELSYSQIHVMNEFILIRNLKEKYDLSIGLHIWDNFPEMGIEKSIEKMNEYLNFSWISKIDFITAHLGKYYERRKGLHIVFKILKEVIPLFESKNVKICIENHYIDELGNSPEEFLYIFENIKSNNLKFCFDCGHANLTGNIFDFIEKLYKFLEIIHISDNNGEKDEHLYYGDGNIKWKEFLNFTFKKNFFGPYIIEFGGQNENIEKINKFKNDLRFIAKSLQI